MTKQICEPRGGAKSFHFIKGRSEEIGRSKGGIESKMEDIPRLNNHVPISPLHTIY